MTRQEVARPQKTILGLQILAIVGLIITILRPVLLLDVATALYVIFVVLVSLKYRAYGLIRKNNPQ